MKHFISIALLLTSMTACDPAHEYYKASGQRDQDESKYIGAFVVCSIFLQEEGTRQKEECLASGGILYKCGEIESTVLLMIPFCAETLADVPPGEFNDLDFGGM